MKLRNKKTGGLANCEPIEVKTDAGFHDYYSLAELNEEWEDYKPTEPLIKDEKVRKAVRAWAEANNIKAVYYSPEEDGFYVKNFDDEIVASKPYEPIYDYDSLARGWEYYAEPAEPLIKDEKIRKAVRAWAEAVGTECVEITHSRSHFIRFMSYLADEDELCMSREIGQIFDEKLYTIAELCGEEGE